MSEKENGDVPSDKEEGQTSEPASGSPDPGSAKKPDGEALSKVPDTLKDKSAEELVQMYQNLEKKLGEQSSEVKEAREAKKNVEILLGAIYADPKRYEQASTWIIDFLVVNSQ